MAKLGFVRSEPAETGRPGYDPRDLLKLYFYGVPVADPVLAPVKTECQRNVEVMWLLGHWFPITSRSPSSDVCIARRVLDSCVLMPTKAYKSPRSFLY